MEHIPVEETQYLGFQNKHTARCIHWPFPAKSLDQRFHCHGSWSARKKFRGGSPNIKGSYRKYTCRAVNWSARPELMGLMWERFPRHAPVYGMGTPSTRFGDSFPLTGSTQISVYDGVPVSYRSASLVDCNRTAFGSDWAFPNTSGNSPITNTKQAKNVIQFMYSSSHQYNHYQYGRKKKDNRRYGPSALTKLLESAGWISTNSTSTKVIM